jgi:hypothetical protein
MHASKSRQYTTDPCTPLLLRHTRPTVRLAWRFGAIGFLLLRAFAPIHDDSLAGFLPGHLLVVSFRPTTF